jgi:Zn-dependent protease/CBS domain-containing protein
MDEIKIGKIFGIEVSLHVSFFFLILIFAIFGIMSLVFLFLLFASVFLHELAHSIIGKNNGLHINKILLLPLGGLSEIKENEIPSKIEVKVALAGPIFNLFIGFLAAAFATISIYPFSSIFQYLFIVNILLGLSNLLPAFPFDGGKIFRGILSTRLNFSDATSLTKRLGDFLIIIVFVISTAWGFIENDFSILVWNLLIIIMVFEAGNYEVEMANLRLQISGSKVKDAVEKNFVILDKDEKVEKALKFIEKHVYVLSKNKGSFYILDLNSLKSKNQRIEEVSKQIPIVEENENLIDIVQSIKEVGVVGVLRKNEIVGIITPLSLKLFILKKRENKKENKNKKFKI